MAYRQYEDGSERMRGVCRERRISRSIKVATAMLMVLVGAILYGDEYNGPIQYDTKGEVALKGSRAGQLFTEQSFRFNIGDFVYRRGFRRSDDVVTYNTSCRIGFRNAGHAGGMTLFAHYSDIQPWPLPESYWTGKGRDNTSICQLTLPMLRKDKQIASCSFRLLQLPSLLDWVFIRVSFEGNLPNSFSWNFDGGWAEFDPKYSKNAAAARLVHSSGKAFSGKNEDTPEISAPNFSFGLYAQNTKNLDNSSTILIAKIPDNLKASLRFRGKSQTVILSLNGLNRSKTRELYFALGNFKGASGQGVVEDFFRGGGESEITGRLASLDWNPVMNADDLKRFPAAGQSRLAALFKAGKFDEYFNTVNAGKEQQAQQIRSELDSMLE